MCSSCRCGVPFVWVRFQRPCELPAELPHCIDGYMLLHSLMETSSCLRCVFDLYALASTVCGYLQSTEGDGAKIFVSCIAFRDRVCEDVTEAYRLPPNTYADKCICIVSHAPNFRALRDSLEEIFVLCFSSEGSW